MKPIVLIGMMGSGKTTVGKTLATELNLPWVDTDIYIEGINNQTISSIFEEQGESYFRDCETKALQKLIHQHGVISTGGGIIVRQENRKLLQKETFVIYLKTKIPTLIQRLDTTNRPLLKNENIKQKLTSLFEARAAFYEECAHLTIQTDQLTIHEVVNQIKQKIK